MRRERYALYHDPVQGGYCAAWTDGTVRFVLYTGASEQEAVDAIRRYQNGRPHTRGIVAGGNEPPPLDLLQQP